MARPKKIKISLTEEQYETLFEKADGWFYDLDEESEYYKKLDSLHTAIIKGYNKSTGIIYRFQLIDIDGEYCQENMRPEYK